MPYSKLKNLMILLLALVNLLLGCLILPLHLERQRQRDLEAKELETLFLSCGVNLAVEPPSVGRALYILEFSPKPDAIPPAARAILGEGALAQDGSLPYLSLYTSAAGRCQISRDGSVDAHLAGKAATGSFEREIGTLLEGMRVEAASISDPVRQGAGVYTVTAIQELLGMPVFSSALDFTFRSGALVRIEGDAFFDTTGLCRVGDDECASCAGALVAFLGSRDKLGWVGAELSGVCQGYLRVETASAAVVRLVPGWRISTDTGSFWVNGITLEVSPLEV